MSDNKPVVSQQEGYAKPKGGKFRRHCAKWWWVHLIIFLLIALLVILLVIFVAIPKIAQQKINQAKLYVDGILITQTESQNYTMSINSTIEAHSPVKAVISPFKGQMFLEDFQPHTPFVEIDFPETTSDPNQKVNVTQFVSITDMEAFTIFNTWLLVNESLRVTVSGKTQVKVKGISKKFNVDFTKTITMPGLRNFEGTTVSNTTISLKPDANGDNFKGLVNIPNYSIVNFEIGNASFHNYLLGAEIGTVFIDNMILRPGLVNNFTMHANITQAPVLTAMGEKPYCETGKLPFQLRGKSVFNHGQPLSYYADSLATSNQSVEIDIATPLKKDLKLTIPCNT